MLRAVRTAILAPSGTKRSSQVRLLTLNELRNVLGGRGRTTIYRDIAAGRIPAPIKIGGRLYWREDEIEAFFMEMANE